MGAPSLPGESTWLLVFPQGMPPVLGLAEGWACVWEEQVCPRTGQEVASTWALDSVGTTCDGGTGSLLK